MTNSAFFRDRIALVTGAARGIGAAAAKALAGAGAHVVLVARPKSLGALEELDDEIQSEGGKATLVPMDLAKGDEIDALGAALFDRFGKLDILLANAGILGPLSPAGHITPKDWSEVISVNLTANYRLIRSLEPLLKQSDAARLVFVTSTAARRPKAFWAAYAASKGGLEALAKSYAAETEKHGMVVSILDPGPIRTRMRAAAVPGEDPQILPAPEALQPLILELAGATPPPTGTITGFYDWAGIERATP